jgi:hypothetical protein
MPTRGTSGTLVVCYNEKAAKMPKTHRKAGLDIVVKVTDSEENLRGRFLISAGSLYYFRKNAKEPSRRYSWRQLIELIEEQAAGKQAAKKPPAKPAAKSTVKPLAKTKAQPKASSARKR